MHILQKCESRSEKARDVKIDRLFGIVGFDDIVEQVWRPLFAVVVHEIIAFWLLIEDELDCRVC